MKVDYHVHLEEGPYSFNWLKRTAEAIHHFSAAPNNHNKHTKDWMKESFYKLNERISAGSLSSSWLDLYLEKAKQLRLKEVGIVDHLYRFKEMRPYYEKYIYMENDNLGNLQEKWFNQVASESISHFIELIQTEKQKWENEGIKLKLGIEADYFPGCEVELNDILNQYNWDYVIGSVHFFNGWGFDNPETKERFNSYDLPTLYKEHFNVVKQAISSNLFDIIAHLDNLKAFGFRPDEEILLAYYQEVAQCLKEHNTATEINTGLAYRYPIKEACPSLNFLQILKDYQVPITTSSDSHFPDDLGTMLDEARTQLIEIGYTSIATFSNRTRKEIELV